MFTYDAPPQTAALRAINLRSYEKTDKVKQTSTALMTAMLIAAVLGAAGGYAAWRFVVTDSDANDGEFVALMPATPPAPPAELLGTPAPEFDLPALAGGTRSLDEWRGKVVLLNFWGTWCAPCREEMPMLIKLRQEFAARGFEVVGLAVDDRDAIDAFSREFGINFPLAYGDTPILELSQRYGNKIGALPYSVLVDRLGKISYLHAGILDESTVRKRVIDLL